MERAYAAIPAEFKEKLLNVTILVRDEPGPETYVVGVPSPFPRRKPRAVAPTARRNAERGPSAP